jgi:hypothetical protein
VGGLVATWNGAGFTVFCGKGTLRDGHVTGGARSATSDACLIVKADSTTALDFTRTGCDGKQRLDATAKS